MLRRVHADEAAANVLQELREPGKDADVLAFQIGLAAGAFVNVAAVASWLKDFQKP